MFSLSIYYIFAGTIIGSIIFNFFGKIFIVFFFLTTVSVFLAIASKNKIFIACAIIFISASATIWSGLSIFKESKIVQHAEREISVAGEIVGEADKRETNTKLTILVDFFEVDNQKYLQTKKLL